MFASQMTTPETKSDDSTFIVRANHAELKAEIKQLLKKVTRKGKSSEDETFLSYVLTIMESAFEYADGQSDLSISEAVFDWMVDDNEEDIGSYLTSIPYWYAREIQERYLNLLIRLETLGISPRRIVNFKKKLGHPGNYGLKFCDRYIDQPGCAEHLLNLMCQNFDDRYGFSKLISGMNESSVENDLYLSVLQKLANNKNLSSESLLNLYRLLQDKMNHLMYTMDAELYQQKYKDLNLVVVCRILCSPNTNEISMKNDYLKYKLDLCEYIISLPENVEALDHKLALLSQALNKDKTLGKFFLLPRRVIGEPSIEKGTLLQLKKTYDRLDPKKTFVFQEPELITAQETQEEKSKIDFSSFYIQRDYKNIINRIKTILFHDKSSLPEIIQLIKFVLKYGIGGNNTEMAFKLLHMSGENEKSLDEILMGCNNRSLIASYYELLEDLESQGISSDRMLKFKKTLYHIKIASYSLNFCKNHLNTKDISILLNLIFPPSENGLGQSTAQSNTKEDFILYADILENIIERNLTSSQKMLVLNSFVVKITGYISSFEFQFEKDKVFTWRTFIKRSGNHWDEIEIRFDRLFAEHLIKCLRDEAFYRNIKGQAFTALVQGGKKIVYKYIISLEDKVKKKELLDEVAKPGTALNEYIGTPRSWHGINIRGGKAYKLKLEREQMVREANGTQTFSIAGFVSSFFGSTKNNVTNTQPKVSSNDNDGVTKHIMNVQL